MSDSHPVLNKQNVGQILLLRHKATSSYVLAANCHILYNINRGDIKTAQIYLLRRSIEMVRNQQQLELGLKHEIPVVWGGDFNTTPNSPMYGFIKSGDFSVC